MVPNFWTRNASPKHGKTVGGTANQSSSQAAKHLVFHPINGYLGAQNESSNLQMWMVSDQRSANSLDPEDKDLTLEADHLGIPSLKFSSFKGFPPKGKKTQHGGTKLIGQRISTGCRGSWCPASWFQFNSLSCLRWLGSAWPI